MDFMDDTHIPFAHFCTEFFFADLVYVGANHMIHPWKKGEAVESGSKVLGWCDEQRNFHSVRPDGKAIQVSRKKYFKAVHQKIRSREERTFAWMAFWKWTQYCQKDERFMELAMAICVSFEAFIGFRKTECPTKGSFNALLPLGRLT